MDEIWVSGLVKLTWLKRVTGVTGRLLLTTNFCESTCPSIDRVYAKWRLSIEHKRVSNGGTCGGTIAKQIFGRNLKRWPLTLIEFA